MTNAPSIASPELLKITEDDQVFWGADQAWYATKWQQNAGCGPTNCAHLMYYLACTRDGCSPLCPEKRPTRGGFRALMDSVWHYVTPGKMGVHTTDLFTDGAMRYATERGVPLSAKSLEIPASRKARPGTDAVHAFLDAAFANDLPVAFLNLSRGALRNLEGWHWVTLIALKDGKAHVVDQGNSYWIDLDLWLKTSRMGGGFVILEPGDCALQAAQ